MIPARGKKMTTFHFTKEMPPDTMFSDIQKLNRFQEEQFQQLVQIVFSFLQDPTKSSRMLAQLDEFAEEHGVSAAGVKNITKSLLTIPNSALKINLGPNELKEDLESLGLSEEKTTYFTEQWCQNLVSLSKSSLGQTLVVNQLVDMEWKFGVTVGSSDVGKVGNTFLQLKLVINKGNKLENTYMELTLPQFYSFLHEMEKAKTSLEYFS